MHLQRQRIAGRRTLGWVAVLGALLTMVVSVSPAGAADSSAPVLSPGTFSAPRTATTTGVHTRDAEPLRHRRRRRRQVPVLPRRRPDLRRRPGDGRTCRDGHRAVSQEGNTTVRYRAVDTSGNVSRGATANTTLNQASAAGATAIRLSSTAGRSAGDLLVIDTGAGQETATIATIVTPAPASPAPNVTLTAPLANAHAAGAAVRGRRLQHHRGPDRHQGPVATWATQPTTLQPGGRRRASGCHRLRLASTTGRVVGDTLQVDQGANAETVTIASIVTPPPPRRSRTSS